MLFVLLRKLFGAMTHQAYSGPLLWWHPVLIASWIGLLITSLNLVPAGQLDGGHILYSVSPRLHRALTWMVLATLLVLGVFYWVGWLLWASLLLLPGMRHPKVHGRNAAVQADARTWRRLLRNFSADGHAHAVPGSEPGADHPLVEAVSSEE